MLLAELHGKFRGHDIEDVLTSTVFGLLRYSDQRLALEPLLDQCMVGAVGQAWELKPWPRHQVSSLRVDDVCVSEVTCEPDMVIEGPDGVVVMEAKLGAPLGGDPMQLPQEALVAHQIAGAKKWRLLCVTTHYAIPMIASFRASGSRIELGEQMPVNEAVASYFQALAEIGTPGNWPDANEVRANVLWLSWRTIAMLIDSAVATYPTRAEHEVALARDVLRLLRERFPEEEPFHGFRKLPTQTLVARLPELWTGGRPTIRINWSYPSSDLAWPLQDWLAPKPSPSENAPIFSALINKPLSWPAMRWLARG